MKSEKQKLENVIMRFIEIRDYYKGLAGSDMQIRAISFDNALDIIKEEFSYEEVNDE